MRETFSRVLQAAHDCERLDPGNAIARDLTQQLLRRRGA